MIYSISLLAFALAILHGISAVEEKHLTGFVHDNARTTDIVEALQWADKAEKQLSYEFVALEKLLQIELNGAYKCEPSPISVNPPLPATVFFYHGKYIIDQLQEKADETVREKRVDKDQVISPTTSKFAKIERMEHTAYTCKNDSSHQIHIVRSDVNMEYDYTMDFIFQLLDGHYRRAFIEGKPTGVTFTGIEIPAVIEEKKTSEY